MDISLLNARVTFQKKSVTTDRYGNQLAEWTDF